MKKIFVISAVVLFGLVLLSNDSYAIKNDEIDNNIDLVLKKDSDINVIKEYIEIIDNNLISNSSFSTSSKLSSNYEFLTDFAISFILDHDDSYDILVMDEYIYNSSYDGIFKTNKYVNKELIYEITDSVFGVGYYYITNDYLDSDSDLIPLIRINKDNVLMEISDIVKIDRYDNYMDVSVKYKDIDIIYIYRFEYDNDNLIFSDLVLK